ncbi:hypothetical protein [Jonesia quinghaiensis]|uniref:hypothetical protein n=1 Tax=Jonesia quinghaiensis TaxID=262806 RepID=UPI000428FEE5|nr:hypothetical protein [Jonesia quinghaiensis]
MEYDSIADVPTFVLAIGGALGLGLVFGHVWLSRRNPVWLGGIVPAIYVIANIVFVVIDRPRAGEMIGTGLTLLALLVVWWAGEDTRQRRRGLPVTE